MHCSIPQNDAASNLPEDATIFGLPLHFVRQFAEARREIKFGTMTVYVSDDREERITVEKSIKILSPMKKTARLQPS